MHFVLSNDKNEDQFMIYDIIIIGAGPAGLTAAIYAGRDRLQTLLISKDLGGQTAISGEIGNYPGLETAQGIELVEKMRQQAEKLETVKINIGPDRGVSKIEKTNVGFIITNGKGEQYETKSIIIAAGKDPKRLNVPGEKEFEGRGVNFCATCDAPLYRQKNVAIIGGGYSAAKAAYTLLGYAQKIYILMTGEQLGGEAVILDKIKNAPQIQIVPFAQTTAIKNDGAKVTGVTYTQNGKTGEVAVDGVFVEIGSTPNTAIFNNLIKLNEVGEVEVDAKNTTSTPGIFAAGDITSIWAKQIVIAAGDGAKAAIAASEYLANQKTV
jgi:alkyl hydroperoxide reductase subunit F